MKEYIRFYNNEYNRWDKEYSDLSFDICQESRSAKTAHGACAIIDKHLWNIGKVRIKKWTASKVLETWNGQDNLDNRIVIEESRLEDAEYDYEEHKKDVEIEIKYAYTNGISWALETLTEFKAREPDMIADIISSRRAIRALKKIRREVGIQ